MWNCHASYRTLRKYSNPSTGSSVSKSGSIASNGKHCERREGSIFIILHTLILLHTLRILLIFLPAASRRRARQRRMKLTSSSFQERRREGRAPFCCFPIPAEQEKTSLVCQLHLIPKEERETEEKRETKHPVLNKRESPHDTKKK